MTESELNISQILIQIGRDLGPDENEPNSTNEIFVTPEVLIEMAQLLPDDEVSTPTRAFLNHMCLDGEKVNGLECSLYQNPETGRATITLYSESEAADLYFATRDNDQIGIPEEFLIFLEDEEDGENDVQIIRTDEIIEFEESQYEWSPEQKAMLVSFMLYALVNQIRINSDQEV